MPTPLRRSALLLCALLPVAAFAQKDWFKVTYQAGSVPGFHAGDEFRLSVDSKGIRFSKEEKQDVLVIPLPSVDELSFGSGVVRRVKAVNASDKAPPNSSQPAAPAKSGKPYIGITWVDGDRKGALAIECDKSDYTAILTHLQRGVGKKPVDSDAASVKR